MKTNNRKKNKQIRTNKQTNKNKRNSCIWNQKELFMKKEEKSK